MLRNLDPRPGKVIWKKLHFMCEISCTVKRGSVVEFPFTYATDIIVNSVHARCHSRSPTSAEQSNTGSYKINPNILAFSISIRRVPSLISIESLEQISSNFVNNWDCSLARGNAPSRDPAVLVMAGSALSPWLGAVSNCVSVQFLWLSIIMV